MDAQTLGTLKALVIVYLAAAVSSTEGSYSNQPSAVSNQLSANGLRVDQPNARQGILSLPVLSRVEGSKDGTTERPSTSSGCPIKMPYLKLSTHVEL
jgi:hypothetical protein